MIIKLETDLGEVELFFDVQNAPLTAKYFEELVVEGSLDMTSFFRIVSQDSQSSQQGSPIEVLQCGIWKESQEELTKLEHESTNLTGLKHRKWSLSTARYGIGTAYGSFFICMRDEPQLDFGGSRHPDGFGFAVFGKVVSGFDVLETIYRNREPEEFQLQAVVIKRAAVLT